MLKGQEGDEEPSAEAKMGQSEVSTGQDEAPPATWRQGCARHVAGEGFPRGVTPHTAVSGAAAKFSGAGKEGG